MSPPSEIPSSGPKDSIPTYPPVARVKTDKQPTAKVEMNLRPGQETGANRLRGGCIPCPVRVTTRNFFFTRPPLLTVDLTGWMLFLYPHPLLLLIASKPPRRVAAFLPLPSYALSMRSMDMITDNRSVTICN